MSYVRIFVHLIFTTKNRQPFLNNLEIRKTVFDHMENNAKEKRILLDCVNGFDDHAHCLLRLGSEQCIATISNLIKGESSYWINKQKLTSNHFSWQDDYWAISVEEDDLFSLRDYIRHQEDHHRNKSFDEELKEILRKYGEEKGLKP